MKKLCCYWCGQSATSREHVPPKCLFPIASDTSDGKDHREQLITVPSCDLHNAAKSHDDEYLLCVLAFSILNNPVGQQQAASKVLRALKQAPRLAEQVLGKSKEITIQDASTGKIDSTIAFMVEQTRLDSALEHIARGLYFHHYRTPWQGTLRVLSEFLVALDSPAAGARNARIQELRDSASEFFSSVDRNGANPSVFFYQLFDDPKVHPHKIVARLTFYGATSVLAFFES